ncbi:MAG: hypothetical protein Q8P02_01020, partial [Candidatus Micrarchaeota archaeon]|nr:hypothetical protein [Candidatus Micrarchaeota archaeon]
MKIQHAVLWLALLAASAGAIRFSEYAFWFPDVADPVSVASCAGLEAPLALTPVAAQKPGFDGVKMAQAALQKMQTVRRMALLQKSPLFWGGANLAGYVALSVMCHQKAADAMRDAVAGVNANWLALDAAIAQAEFAGLQHDGPSKAIFGQLDQAQADIQQRNAGSKSAGAAFVRALNAVQQAVESPSRQIEALDALIGPGGLLETQVRAVEMVEGLSNAQNQENRKTGDRAAHAITDARRLQRELEEEKAFLVPEKVFSLQTATFAQSESVQDFATAWRQAQADAEDADEAVKKADGSWKKKEKEYAAVAQAYLEEALDKATQAQTALENLKRQTQGLEADLLKKADAAKARLKTRLQTETGPAAWRLEQAMQTLARPLPA